MENYEQDFGREKISEKGFHFPFSIYQFGIRCVNHWEKLSILFSFVFVEKSFCFFSLSDERKYSAFDVVATPSNVNDIVVNE